MESKNNKIKILEEIEKLAIISCELLNVREVDRLKGDFRREFEELISEKNAKVRKKEDKIFDVTIEINGKERRLRKKIIHGRKLEPIYGADLAIEFPNQKIIFIQWKKVKKENSGKKFDIRRDQLLTLIKLCRMLCKCYCPLPLWKCECYRRFCPPINCGSTFYALDFLKEVRYIRACDLAFILGWRKSISAREVKSAAMSKDVFKEKLLKCKIGCRDLPQQEKERIFELYCVITNRIVYLLEIL